MVFDCSIVIPLYNKGAYIERALRSVGAQTCRPREIIVVDDGSRDDGPDKVSAFAAIGSSQAGVPMPPITLIRQANAGVSAARNRGIREAKGRWVAFLDADDVHLPWFLSEIEGLAALQTGADLLATNFAEFAGEFDLGAAVKRHGEGGGSRRESEPRGVVSNFFDRWWRGSFFFTSSVCVRRSFLQGFDEPFKVGEQHGEDLDLFFRTAETGTIAWSPRVSAIYSVDVPGSLMHAGTELLPVPAFERLKARMQTGAFPAGLLEGAQRAIATYWMTIARARLQAGDVAGAVELLADPVTRHRPVYWLRTAAMLLPAACRRVVSPRAERLPTSVKTQKSKP